MCSRALTENNAHKNSIIRKKCYYSNPGVRKRSTPITQKSTKLFVVCIPPDPISLCKISQINNFGFVPGKVFRYRARALYKNGCFDIGHICGLGGIGGSDDVIGDDR